MKKTSSLILLLLISSLPTLSQNLSQSSYYKVYFDSDKHHVRQTEHQELQKLIKKAQNAGYYEIDIQAHTDFDGSISYNQKLSERRAESVVGFSREPRIE
jgi:outer membrane protein OmpA-like peptidoglycan-associated protein